MSAPVKRYASAAIASLLRDLARRSGNPNLSQAADQVEHDAATIAQLRIDLAATRDALETVRAEWDAACAVLRAVVSGCDEPWPPGWNEADWRKITAAAMKCIGTGETDG